MLRAAVSAMLLCGCIVEEEPETGAGAEEASCAATPGVYTPYVEAVAYDSGPVAELPWRGEDFEAYAPGATVECADGKALRAHLDVTAGCLEAVALGERAYHRGRISPGTFRAVALGAKWTDQSIEYRFHYRAPSGGGAKPGFKAFARYRTEDDLYVASWRLDGTAHIQKKHCGRYTTLAATSHPPPAPGTWHRLRFDALDDDLHLYLDGAPVLSATSATFSWGTAGIRADGVSGAHLDDWRLTSP